jgi:glycosyltransferase involved in cell wall biosynthesis
MKPRRIVFVNRYFDPDQSATSQMLTDLAHGLSGIGWTVEVVCSRQLYDDPKALLASVEMRGNVLVHRSHTTHFGRSRLIGRAVDYASFYVSAAYRLLRVLKPRDILIAKTDPPLLSLLAAPIARWTGAHLVNWQQDVFPEIATQLGSNPLSGPFDRLLRGLRNASLRRASMNVVISERMAGYFAQQGIPSDRLSVIENWADGDAIQPKPAGASRLRRQLALGGRFLVCYSGNLGRAHEFATLLGAADSLRGDPSVGFLMIGGGAKLDGLRRAVAELKLDNFMFLEYQPRENLSDSLAAGDLHLVSLRPELEGLIMPSKLYGILAAGRPVIFIGDATGDVARMIRRAECGETVPIGASAALVAAIRRMQCDPAQRAAMGARARQAFTAYHTREEAIDRWRMLLELIPAPRADVVRPPEPSNR